MIMYDYEDEDSFESYNKHQRRRQKLKSDKEQRSAERRIKKASSDYKRQKLMPRNITMISEYDYYDYNYTFDFSGDDDD